MIENIDRREMKEPVLAHYLKFIARGSPVARRTGGLRSHDVLA
jgi:hypothetical protein